MRPAAPRNWPARSEIKVVLPAPFGPSRPKMPPALAALLRALAAEEKQFFRDVNAAQRAWAC